MQLPAISPSLSASPLAQPALGASKNTVAPGKTTTQAGASEESSANTARPSSTTKQSGNQALTEADYRVIAELKKIDRSVRAHETAHLAAAGGLARGGASFTYTQGPDGQRYAVGGEVSIDTSPERDDPEATILKAQRIQAAALAPAQPSDADRAVAASAAQMAAAARAELAAERYSEDESETNTELSENTAGNDTDTSHSKTKDNDTVMDAAKELSRLIQRATSTENALGNILNATA